MHLFVTVLTIGLLVFQGMLAAAIIAPQDLGLNHQVIAWMSVFNVGVGVLLNQLKSLGSSQPTPPATKAPGAGLGGDGEASPPQPPPTNAARSPR